MFDKQLRTYAPVLVLAPLLFAGAPGLPADDGDWRGARSRGGNSYARTSNSYRGSPVHIALRDLQSIASRARVDGHEAKHFRRAIQELAQFEERSRRGRFDRGSLDDAIGNMEHLARADQLHPRDRSRIREDMFALRRLRSGYRR